MIVTVRRQGAGFVGEPDSLVTKCPSKFATEQARRDLRLGPRPADRSRSAIEVYGIGASVYGVRARPAAHGSIRAGAPCTRSPALLTLAFAMLEAAFLRSDFSLPWWPSTRAPPRRPSTGRPPRGPRRRARCCCGSGCCRSGRAWCSSSRAAECARSPPAPRRCCSGSPPSSRCCCVFLAEPFAARCIRRRSEGLGLNPLLRHPSMMIHPPMLYSGYTLFTIPFAFAVGALVARRLDAEWIRATRPLRADGVALPRLRHPARRPLVVRRARLGRVLGAGIRSRTRR